VHYNLLYYGTTTSFCTTQNNNINTKTAAIDTIMKYIKPDLFTANEIGANSFAPQNLLDNALNTGGTNYYEKAQMTNSSGGNIMNMLYYDSRKFNLYSQKHLTTPVRDINFYTLYYISEALYSLNDTAFLTVITTHLKSGNSSADENTRASLTQQLMQHLDSFPVNGPVLFSGDLNLYHANEQAWQNLTAFPNAYIRFMDPINQPGNWNNNSVFAPYHTQSTHSASNGCAAGGGLDDRFDFILMNNNLINGLNHYQYLPNSYKSIGNDGNHFNQSINAPTNNSVPPNVLQALYDNSDHLPVMAKIIVDQHFTSIANNHHPVKGYAVIENGQLTVNAININSYNTLKLFDMQGRIILNKTLKTSENTPVITNIPPLKNGIYIVLLQSNHLPGFTIKVVYNAQ
jgi:hypothetical protein